MNVDMNKLFPLWGGTCQALPYAKCNDAEQTFTHRCDLFSHF